MADLSLHSDECEKDNSMTSLLQPGEINAEAFLGTELSTLGWDQGCRTERKAEALLLKFAWSTLTKEADQCGAFDNN